MKTYQDFLKASDKLVFIIQAMDEYRASEMHSKAEEADAYYRGENPRLPKFFNQIELEGSRQSLNTGPKIPITTGLFKRLVKLQVNSLWYYGAQVDKDANKTALGENFDYTARNISKKACLHGVSYGFWNVNKLQHFTALEYFPLKNERDGADMAGIRFWRLDETRPWIVQLYEMDGWTEYTREGSKLTPALDANGREIGKQAYKIATREDALGVAVVSTGNYLDAEDKPLLPILPMYANEDHTSELTAPIRSKIDIKDAVLSTFGDEVMRAKILYWILEGFSGNVEDLLGIRAEMEKYGLIATNEATRIDAKTVEVPFDNVRAFLQYLDAEIYKDFMAMNTDEITGGSLTNVAINTANHAESMKVSDFEWASADFVDRLFKLIGVTNAKVQFKRKTISNDMEITQRIIMLAGVGALDIQAMLELDPLILPEEVAIILARLLEEAALQVDDGVDDNPAGAVAEGASV